MLLYFVRYFGTTRTTTNYPVRMTQDESYKKEGYYGECVIVMYRIESQERFWCVLTLFDPTFPPVAVLWVLVASKTSNQYRPESDGGL